MIDEPDGWPDDLTVTSPRVEVILDGEVFVAESVTVRQEIATSMPEGIGAATGESVPSASLVVRSAALVETVGSVSPWRAGSWAPRLWGRPCEVRISLNGSDSAQVFGGQVHALSGSVDEVSVSVDADGIGAWLHGEVSLWPLAGEGYREDEEQAYGRAFAGVTPVSVLDRLARGAGFHSVPPPSAANAFFVAAQGSLAPEHGVFLSSDVMPGVEPAPWGWGAWMTGLDNVRWRTGHLPAFDDPQPAESRVTAWTSDTSGLVLEARAGTTVVFGNEFRYRVTVNPGNVVVETSTGGPWAEQLTLDQAIGAGPLTLRLTENWIRLRAPDGTEVEAAHPAGRSTRSIRTILVHEGSVGPVYLDSSDLGDMPPPYDQLDFDQTFVADCSLTGNLAVTPWIDRRSRWEVMREIAESESGAILDMGDGKLRFRNRDSIGGAGNVVATLSASDLSAVPWQMGDEVRSSVSVGWIEPEMQVDEESDSTIEVWRPEEYISLRPNVAWSHTVELDWDIVLGIDTRLYWLGDEWPPAIGSLGNAWRTDRIDPGTGRTHGSQDDGEQVEYEIWQPRPSELYVRLQWVLPEGIIGTPTLYLGGAASMSSPVIRASLAARWMDEQTHTITTGRPSARGESTISVEGTPWRQTQAQAREYAQWLARQLGGIQAVPQWVEMARPNLLLQLGDTISVDASDAAGISRRALVVGNEITVGADGDIAQKLRLRLLGWMFDDFNQVWTGATFDDFNAVWGSLATFDDFNADPLRTE